MPELPEVETIMCGLKPHIEGAIIQSAVVRFPTLRWPIPSDLEKKLKQQSIKTITRRGKYLLIHVDSGTLIIHLGMSGRLLLLTNQAPLKPHDHVDIILNDRRLLRYNDPRRFGALLWTTENPNDHPLLASLGKEPLAADFSADYLRIKARHKRQAIKSFLMDSHIVVGIGNIYAAESLFLAKIHPTTPVNGITPPQWERLVKAIQQTLRSAIRQGGTTLKDFVDSTGKPGYFVHQLNVYGRRGKPCVDCHQPLDQMTLGQRSTVFCAHCQRDFVDVGEVESVSDSESKSSEPSK